MTAMWHQTLEKREKNPPPQKKKKNIWKMKKKANVTRRVAAYCPSV